MVVRCARGRKLSPSTPGARVTCLKIKYYKPRGMGSYLEGPGAWQNTCRGGKSQVRGREIRSGESN
jgi:hypothetical protein